MYLYPYPIHLRRKPLTNTVDGKETLFAFICTFFSWWFDGLRELFPPAMLCKLLRCWEDGKETKCSLAGVLSPCCNQHAVGRGTRPPPYGPAAQAAFSATLRAAAEVGEGWDGTILRDSPVLRTDVYKLFIKFPSYICH